MLISMGQYVADSFGEMISQKFGNVDAPLSFQVLDEGEGRLYRHSDRAMAVVRHLSLWT